MKIIEQDFHIINGKRIQTLIMISLSILIILLNIQIIQEQVNFYSVASASSTLFNTNWSAPGSYTSCNRLEVNDYTGDLKLHYGQKIYITDSANNRIIETMMDGSIWVNYGTLGSGIGQFDFPTGIYYDINMDQIYIADPSNHRIVRTKIDGTGWTTYGTYGSGQGQFYNPGGIHYDCGTDFIYVADTYNHRIVKTKINGASWTTYGTFGNGTGEFGYPRDVYYDNKTDYLYVADTGNSRIVKTKIDGSEWTTYGSSGNGTGQFYNPIKICHDENSNFIYVTDIFNSRIIKTKINGSGWTVYGSSGSGTDQFNRPCGIYFDPETDFVYITDRDNNRIIKTMMNGSGWTTYGSLGNGIGQFDAPWDIELSKLGYCHNGFLISKKYFLNGPMNILSLGWTADLPQGTSVKFQLRTGQNESDLITNKFVGFNGISTDYYNISGTNVWNGHDGDKWLQYKVYLETTDISKTPVLKDITIVYNLLPNKPMIITPENNAMTNDNSPLFSWIHNDTDSTSQVGYQWQMDDDLDFKSIDYDCKITTSSQNTFIPTIKIPDGIWYWRLRTCDSDGGWGMYCNSMKIFIDTKPPESMIIKPQNNSFYKQMNNIKGTSLDLDVCSGINRTELFIKRFSDNKYWTGLEWESDQLWLSTTGFEHWKYNSSLVNWTSNERYLIQSLAFDNATNQEIIGIGIVFNYDTDPPISIVEIPVNNSAYNNLGTISGKTYDIGGCGVKEVEIMIKEQETGKCWNGKKWVNTKTWLTATGNSTWSYDSRDVLWENGERYIITSRATDKLDNIEIISNSNTFIFDINQPYSTIVHPRENTYLNRVETISGNATDTGGSGIANIEISIKDRSSNQYWNGNRWQEKEFWLITNGADNWAYNASSISWTSDVYYQIYSKPTDKAGNYLVSEPGNIFMYDSKPPEVSFLINDDARYTNSTTITLTIDTSDTGSGVSQMSFSFDGDQWSNWEQIRDTKILNLSTSTGDGEKTVYLRVSDNANNTASPISKKIILDTDPPVGSIIVNDDNEFTNSKDIIITLTGSDILSGVKDMSFSSDNLTWSPWEPFSKTGSYKLSGSDGEKIVYFHLCDQAGNIGITSDMIILDTTPPSMLEIIINDGALSTERTEVTLKLTASDQFSGVDKMSFCTLDQNWSSWEDFSDVKSYNLTSRNGEKQIFYRVKDKAGNIAVPASARITLVLPTPETQKQKPDDTNWFLLILIIIIIVIILLISIKMIVYKKKRNKLMSSEDQDLNQDQPEDSSSNFSKNGDMEESLTATNEPEQLSTVPVVPELDTDIKQLLQLPPAQLEKQNGSSDEDVTK